MKENNLSEQLNEIREKFSISNSLFYEFAQSINNYLEGNESIGFKEKISQSWESLNSIKKFQDEIENEIKYLFNSTTDERLPEFITHVKEFNEIYVLKELGYPKIRFTIPKLFEMLKDINWPSAREASELLIEIGTPILQFVKDVFESNDNIWIYWVFIAVLSKFPKEDIILIKKELIEIIKKCYCVDEDISNLAFIILFENDLITDKEILSLIIEDKELNFVLIFSLIQLKSSFSKKLFNIILKINKIESENFLEFLKEIQINISDKERNEILKIIQY